MLGGCPAVGAIMANKGKLYIIAAPSGAGKNQSG
ncbi:guanylate kinase [Endozoicomonas sp. NE43]